MAKPFLLLTLLCASLTFITTCVALHLELTHVDAKEGCTVGERLRRATERTRRRRLASSSMAGGVTAPVHWAGTSSPQYIAEYLIGEPPQQAEAIIDTGSNLIWTQCSTCRLVTSCFPQNFPLYDPSQSSTARAVACSEAACALGSETQPCNNTSSSNNNTPCVVLTSYGAGEIAGVLGTETFTFGSSNEVSQLAFGCISATKLTPGSLNNASGIIGLGRGNLSLVSQLGATNFSYCLTPYLSDATVNTSHLFVGSPAGPIGEAPVTSVPFIESPSDDPFNTFYFLPLTGISVGQVKLDVPAAAFDLRQVAPGQWAGTLIDSGSPFTILVDVAYQALRSELERQLGASVIVPLPNDADVESELCVASGDTSLVPPLVLHFGGGGDAVVPPENYWAPVDTDTACMVVYSSGGPNTTLPSNETTVIGNYMQQNTHLLYDLANGVLSFQAADCSSM
ncbi:hypothetical protein HU200_003359 [Digitaria exilis]|uniref:Peptidase A1 domain-containing protein n=1 Tax=Digitaria exilis TaxID=1010633 RepID=A0A835KUF3_9POAL|nr:hypothetical protein HU200_003359 [Digitaria exilis]